MGCAAKEAVDAAVRRSEATAYAHAVCGWDGQAGGEGVCRKQIGCRCPIRGPEGGDDESEGRGTYGACVRGRVVVARLFERTGVGQ